MLRKVVLALKANGSLGHSVLDPQYDLETSIPAFAIAFLTNPQIEVAYRPLASPAVLVFFIFIILSTLRLNPGSVDSLALSHPSAIFAQLYISAGVLPFSVRQLR